MVILKTMLFRKEGLKVMRKIILLLLLLFITASVLAACLRRPAETPPREIKETVVLFYGDQGNEQLLSEERVISYREGEDRYSVVLTELIAGPQSGNLRANISPQTRVYGTIRQGDALIANVSKEFAQFSGSVAEVLAVLSVVSTLTQFEDVRLVKILVEGEELIGPSGQPRGFMPIAKQEQAPETLTLYFANSQATAVSPEKRKVTLPAGSSLEDRLKITLEELIRGPQIAGLFRTIPEGVRILLVAVEKNIVTVNFSREMETNHPGGAAGESMTINSIVNTLTEFEGIDLVAMTVEGEPMSIEHMILDAPVRRNEAMIER